MTGKNTDLVERLRAKLFSYPAEGQRLELVALEAADYIEGLEATISRSDAELARVCEWLRETAPQYGHEALAQAIERKEWAG